MAWTTPRDWTDGELVTEALLDTHVRDNLKALTEWTSYTPTWAASGGTPTIGNGTLSGEYIEAGELCHVRVRMTMGSTTSISGTTVWNFSLPFASVGAAAGDVMMKDDSGGLDVGVAAVQDGASVMFLIKPTAGYVDALIPWTWATSDYLAVSMTYKVA